ncbi:hypothetical protein [Maioricimonas sp. JC845]|uniref:hypothetical protein n=1 Tax=Maioricimonas sp. JC845 TaxID=3232138 RepID=UPI0034575B7A
MTSEHPDVLYAIDAEDCLVELSSSWQPFAEQNEGGISLNPGSVLGQSLWTFVRGESLQVLYRDVLTTVRRSGRPFEFDYRCDSPALRRHMHMRVEPLPDGIVRFQSRTVRIESRNQPLHVVAASTGHHHLKRCSICNRFGLPDRTWSDVLDAITVGQAMNQDRPLQIIWGICDDCRGNLRTRLEQTAASAE